MLDQALTLRKYNISKKISVKMAVSAGLIALAVLLPQLVHLALGQPGGVKWLPMYLPVLLAGCVMGAGWGAAIGLLSPLVSFLITYLVSTPMPAAQRLPFMMCELAVFALVSGLFSKKISQNAIWAFPAVILAQVCGRAVFLGLVAIFNSLVPFTPTIIWGQIKEGFVGLLVQAVLAPVIVIALKKLLIKDDSDE